MNAKSVTLRGILAAVLSWGVSDCLHGQKTVTRPVTASTTHDFQDQPPSLHAWEPYFEMWVDFEDRSEDEWEDIHELLCTLEEHPVNLNTATREELEALPFLSDRQVSDVLEYIYRYHGIKTKAELIAISSLDYHVWNLLQCFTYIGSQPPSPHPSWKDIWKKGRHELSGYVNIPTYRRKGDLNGYLGPQFRHWLHYDFQSMRKLRFGIVAAQDAGEPFFAGRNRMGYDLYSAYLLVHDVGHLQTLAIGRYKLAFGMGLVMNSGFGMGKTMLSQDISRETNPLRAHTSRSESNYQQGIAGTLTWRHGWSTSAFASYMTIDASLNDDGSAATLTYNSYHRTPKEMERKHNTHAFTGGIHIKKQWRDGHVGTTAVITHLSRTLHPDISQRYRRFSASGNDFANFSLDYAFRRYPFSLRGETAIDRRGAIATLNTARLHLSQYFDLKAIQRFYSYRYTSLHANAFREGSGVQNESGVYAGLQWRPRYGLNIEAYTDFAYFPFMRYQVSQSSHAIDNQASISIHNGEWTIDARYRLHIRQKDARQADGTRDKGRLADIPEHRLRYSAAWQHDRWTARLQADAVSTRDGHTSKGYMISASGGCTSDKGRLLLACRYFHTDDYDSRIYAYEHGIPHIFSLSSFYGHGIRYAITAKLQCTGCLTATARIGVTDYFDRSTIGSGLQMIDGSSACDIELHCRWKF